MKKNISKDKSTEQPILINCQSDWLQQVFLGEKPQAIPFLSWLNSLFHSLSDTNEFAFLSSYHHFLFEKLQKEKFEINYFTKKSLSSSEKIILAEQNLEIENFEHFNLLEKKAFELIRPHLQSVSFASKNASLVKDSLNKAFSLLKNQSHESAHVVNLIHQCQKQYPIAFSDIHIYYDSTVEIEFKKKELQQFDVPYDHLKVQEIPLEHWLCLAKFFSAHFHNDDYSLLYALRFSEIGIGTNTCQKWFQNARHEALTFREYLKNPVDKSDRQQKILHNFFHQLSVIQKIDLARYLEEYVYPEKSPSTKYWDFFKTLNTTYDHYKIQEFSLLTELLALAPSSNTSIKFLPIQGPILDCKVAFILGGEELHQSPVKSVLTEERFKAIAEKTQLSCHLISTCIREIDKFTGHSSIPDWVPTLSFHSQFLEEDIDEFLCAQDFLYYFPEAVRFPAARKSYHAEAIAFKFKVGQEVYHKQFGYGTIQQISEFNDEQSLSVRFESKELLLSSKFSTLTVV